MRHLAPAAAALALAGCTDPYGRIDPARTALLGAGLGAGAFAFAAAASQPVYGPPVYGLPLVAPAPPSWGGWGPPPPLPGVNPKQWYLNGYSAPPTG